MKLAIVVGHTKVSKGAFGIKPINAHEYDYNTEVAQVMYRWAKAFGLECRVFMRDGVGISGVYEQVNEWAFGDNSVCIELHFNAANGRAQGTETLFDNDPSDSIEFAREVQSAMCMVFNRSEKGNRGLKMVQTESRGATNLIKCKITSCLTEPFFGDNPEDAKLGQEFKLEYAKILVETALKFLRERSQSPVMELS